MSVRYTKINGKQKVWMARVAYNGQRTSRVCKPREEARHAEAELLQQLKAKAAQVEEAGRRPATMRALFEFYVADLAARGRGTESVARVVGTARAVERVQPAFSVSTWAA